VQQLDQLVNEIASASSEQSSGIAQINAAVTQMDQVTQSNAASAEECASASEELNAQAETLKDVVAELQQLVGGASAAPNTEPAASVALTVRPKPAAFRKPAHTAQSGNVVSPRNHVEPVFVTARSARKEPEIPMNGDFKGF
jgi:ABC-type transporter Mla subunit MlaD